MKTDKSALTQTVITLPDSNNRHSVDLEIKDAQLIFHQIWSELIKQFGKKNLRFPREIIWAWWSPRFRERYQYTIYFESQGNYSTAHSNQQIIDQPKVQKD